MKHLTIFVISLMSIFCTLTNLSAQGYIPEYGLTIWKTVDGNLVLYRPTTTSSEVEVVAGNGKTMGVIDCNQHPALCQAALEDASDGKTPKLPEEPADGGDDEEPADGGEESQSTRSGPSSMQIFKEYKSYSKQNKGKMYFRSKSGKWSVVKDWQTMQKKILMNIKRR